MDHAGEELVQKLGLDYIRCERVSCIVSQGSKARRVIARIHTLGKAMQEGMRSGPFYTIELISENFEKQLEEEKTKTLIHELLHIPHSFGGGFRHHKLHVNARTVEREWKKLQSGKGKNQNLFTQ
ncbi:MAG: putative metallopeptidase [archaeon]